MYEYIKGTIDEIKANAVVLENQNIGYFIYVPDPYYYKKDEKYQIYIHQNVKEDELTFFGFKSSEEKELFLKLISVKGLGCKMALPLLAGPLDGVLDAIETENINYLKKFPKIGDKVARQIILDLKGKLATNTDVKTSHNFDELTETLKGLGYKPADIKKILPKINASDPLEKQIKEGLKLLLK